MPENSKSLQGDRQRRQRVSRPLPVECRLIIELTDNWKWVEDCYSKWSQRTSWEVWVMMNVGTTCSGIAHAEGTRCTETIKMEKREGIMSLLLWLVHVCRSMRCNSWSIEEEKNINAYLWEEEKAEVCMLRLRRRSESWRGCKQVDTDAGREEKHSRTMIRMARQ